jgi:RNA polymerase sigma factor (sigma-70 family)
MAESVGLILSQLQRWASPHLSELSDAVLLQRFIQRHDESAFAALVARHGGMVLRSCRRVLGDAHEAEDAFQATFLILARKAHTLHQAAALPGYLYSVARRVALKARAKSAAGAKQTPLLSELPDAHSDPLERLTARELLTVLDEEVARLPPAQRSAVVLCCLEGHTREEAASMLDCRVGSLKGHLERGRQRLQARLRRRGIALSAALSILAVSRGEAASPLLLYSTVRAALHGGIDTSAAALAHRVLQAMFLSKLAGVSAVLLVLTLAASITAALVYRWPAAESPEDKTLAVPAASRDAGASKLQVRRDAPADPLPSAAIARLGTQRLRHGGWIKFTAFTPDCKRLVSQGEDGLRVWDAATGKELQHLSPEAGKIWGAADLSPDSKQVAAAIESLDGHIGIWDISSGKKAASFGAGYYALVRFSPDGKQLAAFETANAPRRAVEMWDVASHRRLLSWKAHGGHQVMSLLFSPDSRHLFTCASDGKIRIWDAATGRQVREFSRLDWQLPGRTLSLFNQNETLSPDGKLLALVELSETSTSKAGQVAWKARISLRDTTTGEQVRLLTCPSPEIRPGLAADFSALTFTPDGKKLLTGGPDDFLRVWDVATGEELQRWPLELARPWLLALSRDGKTLAVVMNQGKAIQLLDTASGTLKLSHAGHLLPVGFCALTPEGQTAVTESHDGLLLWDVAKSRVRHRLKEQKADIIGMQLTRNGRTLYTLDWQNKTVSVWDLSKGEERQRFPLGQEFTPSAFGALALAPDGKTLAVLSATKTIRVLDTTSGRELRRWDGPELIRGSAFAADSRFLVVWYGDLKVRIWDTTTGHQQCEYPLPQDLRVGQPKFGFTDGGRGRAIPVPTPFHAALSPDGRQLAIGNDRHVLPLEKCFLVLKDLATGRDIRRLDNLPADVNHIAFSPDGRMLVWSGRMDPTIYLVETPSGRERRRFAGHYGGVISLAFSADGERLISGSTDTTALVWNLGRRLDRGKAALTLTAAEVEKLWTDLAGEDAARAYEAIGKLAAAPTAAIPFLRKHLLPVPAVEEKRLARMLADLESDDFAVRQKAIADLEKLGEAALPAYRKALDDKPPLEARRPLNDLLEKAEQAWWDASGERLRSLRAIEALELAGTKEAREMLATLAAGAEGARLTEEAKAALARLAS